MFKQHFDWRLLSWQIRDLIRKNPPKDTRNFHFQRFHDPRFDESAGSFDNNEFEENYSFIRDIKKREKQELEKELKHLEDNAPRKKEILYLLKRMKNQETTKKLLDKQKQERLQKQNEIMEAAKEGKKPYIPKKSDMKMQRLVESYQTLKKSGKLEKYLEKKRRKQFSKDKKRFYQ
ncbi:ribosomal RNA processing protein 36-like protein [Caerostris darwini]|uniref:rRNA biogenesis protein RRP36 n=1 Tax=Caerostris darwini TaxID=1538125 RepID=A0AAV4QQ01_9ARAC|nr:ribosomal RNA processing protein 36-like protein [Caerostris darwini]